MEDLNKKMNQLENSIANLELLILTAYDKLDELKHEKFMLSKGFNSNMESIRQEMEKMKDGKIL